MADTSAGSAMPKPIEPTGIETGKRPSRKRLIITSVVGIVVMVGLFVVLLPQLGDYRQAIDGLSQISVFWMVMLVLASVGNLVFYPLTVLVSVPGLKYWPGFIERQVGFLISCAIPGGGVFAVGAQYKILAHYRVKPAAAAAAVTADAVWTYLLTLAMPALGVLLLVVTGRNAAGLITIAILGALAVVISIVVIIVTLRSEEGAIKVGRLAERLIGPAFRRFKKPVPDLQSALVRFREQAHDLVAQRWGRLTVTNLVAQTMPILVLLCALGGLGEWPGNLSLVEVFAAYSVAILLVSIPITPGGLGTVDAALVALLVSFGCEGSDAVAADLLWRLVWFLPQILAGVVGGIGYLISQKRRPDLGEPNLGDLPGSEAGLSPA